MAGSVTLDLSEVADFLSCALIFKTLWFLLLPWIYSSILFSVVKTPFFHITGYLFDIKRAVPLFAQG